MQVLTDLRQFETESNPRPLRANESYQAITPTFVINSPRCANTCNDLMSLSEIARVLIAIGKLQLYICAPILSYGAISVF